MSKKIIDETIFAISRALGRLAEYSESYEYDSDVDEAYELVSEVKDQLLKLRNQPQLDNQNKDE
ncbi:hypothetical protein LC605_25875 [Nostoc sp. CHAB 5836]|uniref:hypothetical protein n=1 Tax=Nostoc sp. CHAB 5836 TaxID=2780404 RepID=UPI001E62856F|nr:hypothetical protein [Nostoc sp. CHAB 5836]MCC5618453.1 hypothetical protein [Nostoc sp. CHAB 5836]